MKLYAPKYYKQFKCIANKCRHSCCIGWEIDIDPDTVEKYASISGRYSNKIKKSIDFGETPHFRLGENEKCPHLDECGLCRIISEYDEGLLCDICREHPRFYNDTNYGKEVGIGMSCEEASRIILSSDNYSELYFVEEICGEVEPCDFDALSQRERVYEILLCNELEYCEKLYKIGSEFGVSLSYRSDEEWKQLLLSLEYLDDAHRSLFECFSAECKTSYAYEKQLERAFAYFVYRHCSGTYDMQEFCASVGFSLLCERLLSSLASNNDIDITELARIVSEEIEYSEDNTGAIKAKFYK